MKSYVQTRVSAKRLDRLFRRLIGLRREEGPTEPDRAGADRAGRSGERRRAHEDRCQALDQLPEAHGPGAMPAAGRASGSGFHVEHCRRARSATPGGRAVRGGFDSTHARRRQPRTDEGAAFEPDGDGGPRALRRPAMPAVRRRPTVQDGIDEGADPRGVDGGRRDDHELRARIRTGRRPARDQEARPGDQPGPGPGAFGEQVQELRAVDRPPGGRVRRNGGAREGGERRHAGGDAEGADPGDMPGAAGDGPPAAGARRTAPRDPAAVDPVAGDAAPHRMRARGGRGGTRRAPPRRRARSPASRGGRPRRGRGRRQRRRGGPRSRADRSSSRAPRGAGGFPEDLRGARRR